MKTAYDPRHKNREEAVRQLFAWHFQKKQPIKNKLAQAVIKNQSKIDKTIAQAASEWPIAQINRTDLAILRLAVWELTVAAKEPPKVIIDEAVELAKAYGSEKSSSFINGVLGTVYKKIEKNEKKKS